MLDTNNMKKVLQFLKRLSILFLVITLLVVTTFFIIIEPKVKIQGWASLDKNKLTSIERTVSLLDDEGNSINDYLYDNNKLFTPIEHINEYTINAFLCIEDQRFYSHKGIDYKRMASATVNNLKSLSFKEGASTITQQLIKNTHLTSDKNITRKLQEMRIARDIERNYTKSEILEMYLNILYFGNNIYGVGTASMAILGTNASNLSIAQSALLAGMINNPTRYNPYKNLENAVNRKNLVLKQMLKYNKITQKQYDESLNEEIILQKISSSQHYQYVNNVLLEASNILNCNEKDLFKKNIEIKTNIDSNNQQLLSSILDSVNLEENAYMQAIVLNNLSGKIESYYARADINSAYIKRQPGSTIKPILCYAPAIEKKIIVPITPILDEKMSFGDYNPDNYNNKYNGWISTKDSLKYSSNIVAVKLLEMNTINYSKSFAKNAGIEFSAEDNSLAIALGGLHEGITLKQLANSYQPFANQGNFINSSFIESIKDNNGNILYKHIPHEKQIMSKETAYFINDMLQECVKTGTARRLQSLNNICAKTGTVGDELGNTDAYCVAYSTDQTIAVWIGSKDNNSRIKATGGGQPTDVAKLIFNKVLNKNKNAFIKPNDIITVEIDSRELKNAQKIIPADETVLPIYRLKAEFQKYNLPRNYINYNLEYEKKFNKINPYLIDPDNFQII